MSKPFTKWAAIGGASVAFYSLVTTTALALFLPQARLETLTFKSANMVLHVSSERADSPSDQGFQLATSFPGTDQLYPGAPTVQESFWLWNRSSPGQSLRLTGQMSVGDQDWSQLQHIVQAKLKIHGSSTESPWLSLADWSTQQHTLPGGQLADGSKRRYEFSYRMLDTYPTDPDGAGPLVAGSPIGNELMNKQTVGLVFTIDGSRE
jgi:hypothetical protein